MAGVLSGQIAVVTGGARNIGRATVQALAEVGARVAIIDILAAEAAATCAEMVAQGLDVRAYTADLTDARAVADVFAAIAGDIGSVTLLCNNAGGGTDGAGPMAMVPQDKWWALFDRNVRSTILCAQAVLPSMMERRAGRIINTVSLFAFSWSMGGNSAYNAAKAGVARFTEDMAAEMAGHGICLFAMHPGGVRPAPGTYLTEPLPGMTQQQLAMILSFLNDPPERAAAMSVALASGGADALSGRFFDATEDFEAVLADAAAIIASDARRLRLSRGNS
jgi:3-oxoacyl-[acyl-carrier protein] reductase